MYIRNRGWYSEYFAGWKEELSIKAGFLFAARFLARGEGGALS